MVRSGTYRTSKYGKKLDGDISKDRVEKYGKTQKNIFKSSIQDQVKIEREVKEMERKGKDVD